MTAHTARLLLLLACALAGMQGCAAPGHRSLQAPSRLAPGEAASVAVGQREKPRAAPSPEPTVASADDEDPRDEAIEDGGDLPEELPTVHYQPVDHPLASVSDAELERMLEKDPSSLGSMSFGAANGGMLMNGVQMPPGERWELIDPARAWGTQETVDAIVRCIDAVHEQFPDSPKMQIGHISARRGGALSPHVSHQAGRDVDVSYFYTSPVRWYVRAHAGNLDRARTWAFVRALIVETDVEMILIDGGLQRLLREHALQIGEDPGWVDDVFRGGSGRPALIRHARGHANHIHVRFYSPGARETARRVQPILAQQGKVDPPTVHVTHRARKGDTLGRLANLYGTTVEAIKRANGLRSNLIRAKKTYRIPKRGGVKVAPSQPVSIPPRRLPPAKAGASAQGESVSR
jgi:penicillin-insensitive murein endopeptidase